MGKRYLLLALQGLGDALEATPIGSEIKRLEPSAEIDVVVTRSQPELLFAGLPWVRRVTLLPYWDRGARAFFAALLRECRRDAYDALFLAYPASRAPYHVVAKAFAAKRRIAHRYSRVTPGNLLWVYDDLVEIDAKHNVLRNLDLLRAAGFSPRSEGVAYSVPPSWIGAVRDPRRVVVHVGSVDHDGFALKRWPLESFGDVARVLVDEGFSVTFLAGPDEREVTARVASTDGRFGVFEGTIGDVARFISESALVIANDSGIAHLSAGVGTHAIALHGPTPVEYGPFGTFGHPLRASACPPCFDPVVPFSGCALNIDFACLRKDLTVNDVTRAALGLLASGTRENVMPGG
jgi:ADP-heptose:LPS heptosyltransferase